MRPLCACDVPVHRSLSLTNNLLTGTIQSAINQLVYLQYVSFTAIAVGTRCDTHRALSVSMSSPRQLDLSANALSGSLPAIDQLPALQ